ncbi:hypothetical protein [Cypionkella sp.]|uniref:hypothetical protein n=1 Tax=Cypionkella sp. TaxID=2811411 RepID=UPI003753053F
MEHPFRFSAAACAESLGFQATSLVVFAPPNFSWRPYFQQILQEQHLYEKHMALTQAKGAQGSTPSNTVLKQNTPAVFLPKKSALNPRRKPNFLAQSAAALLLKKQKSD